MCVGEVCALSPAPPLRLLRVLDERAVGRQTGSCDLDIHLSAASGEPLLERVRAGTFSLGLFYRLNMVHLVLPPDWTPDNPPVEPSRATRVV